MTSQDEAILLLIAVMSSVIGSLLGVIIFLLTS